MKCKECKSRCVDEHVSVVLCVHGTCEFSGNSQTAYALFYFTYYGLV